MMMELAVLAILVLPCVLAGIVDPDRVQECYDTVRAGEGTDWCLLGYDGLNLVFQGEGTDYENNPPTLADNKRHFMYIRVPVPALDTVGYAFLTWIGPDVSPLKKARLSSDKAYVKAIWTTFRVEVLTNEDDGQKNYRHIYSKTYNAINSINGYKIGARSILKTLMRRYLKRMHQTRP